EEVFDPLRIVALARLADRLPVQIARLALSLGIHVHTAAIEDRGQPVDAASGEPPAEPCVEAHPQPGPVVARPERVRVARSRRIAVEVREQSVLPGEVLLGVVGHGDDEEGSELVARQPYLAALAEELDDHALGGRFGASSPIALAARARQELLPADLAEGVDEALGLAT